jgi:hypothetical protein
MTDATPETPAPRAEPRARSPLVTLGRDLPALAAVVAADLVVLWGVLELGWSLLATVMAFILQTLAAGFIAYYRARRSHGAGSRDDDPVMVREFFKTYLAVAVASGLIVTMAFGGRLWRPAGWSAEGLYDAFSTWQFYAVVGVLVAAELFVLLVTFIARHEGSFLPPEAAVSEPLRRLFALQAVLLFFGFVVYWRGSPEWGLVTLVVLKAAVDLLLLAFDRLRVARIQAAVEAGQTLREPKDDARRAPRGGRRRSRRR